MRMTRTFRKLASPVGVLTLVASGQGLAAVLWEKDDPARVRLGPLAEGRGHPVLEEAARQLDGYFAGARRAFDLPLDFQGTDFQRAVSRCRAAAQDARHPAARHADRSE